MASPHNLAQISGKHNAIYEAYYRKVDAKGVGTIDAPDAAKFLKKSGLSDVVLSRIWDLSDPKGQGYLDKGGLFVALKLIALAQSGGDLNMRSINVETVNPPKVGEIPKIMPQSIQSVPAKNTDWSMKPGDKQKYEELFESLQPIQGLIPGNKVKGVLMESKLPLDTLGKIWDLADQDKDGSLDKHEFTVAMHLVYSALEKRAVPMTLPAELERPTQSNNGFGDGGFVANFPKEMAPPPVPPLPSVMPAASQPRIPPNIPKVPSLQLISTEPLAPAPLEWVVTQQEKLRYDVIFTQSDIDRDGLVSGFEIKDVFLQSGVPQQCLAHIWSLADTNQSGKLTSDQFALAMWLVDRQKRGIEPPNVLEPNMVPPSMRGDSTAAAIPQLPMEPMHPTYSNPELEMISKEIEELARERRILETDVAQKEADIRIKSGEVRSLQSELDTLAATLKQLENQKGEAQKRLDDLKAQVNKIREQCQKQESTIREQEGELDSKRSELQKLKDEENSLEREYESNRKELENLTRNLQDTQFQISQVKAMVTQLLESQRQMNDALMSCKAAAEADNPSLVSEYSLKLEPDFREARAALEDKPEPKPDPFASSGASNGFNNEPGFGNDSFKPSNGFGGADAFATTEHKGFEDGFGSSTVGFDDSFGGSGAAFQAQFPASDPFGDKKATALPAVTPDVSKDDFGSDPFAILHAPTSASQVLSPSSAQKGPPPRPESPSPALPPKKAKQPPPRPAPPRPLAGPARPAPPTDGFGSTTSAASSSSGGAGGFADFADFENKTKTVVEKDFTEDPFKDYRYEDPFNIKDPFENETSEVPSDPFASCEFKPFDLNNSNTKPEKVGVAMTAEKLTNEPKFDDTFDAFGKISNIKNNNDADDFFDAFSDNFNKNSLKKSINTDAFGDSKLNKNLSTVGVSTTIGLQKNVPAFDAFFDNFEDEFSNINITNNNIKSTTISNISLGKSSNGHSHMSDDFAKFDAFAGDNGNFGAKFDDFNETAAGPLPKKVNNAESSAGVVPKVTEKFASDYSKTDNFDADLQAALQRSLVDQ